MTGHNVDVYPVGLLADVLFLARTVRCAPKHVRQAWRKLRYGFRRSWRRRSYWNGYLAEPTTDHARGGAAATAGRNSAHSGIWTGISPRLWPTH